jgi:hypothetical protein
MHIIRNQVLRMPGLGCFAVMKVSKVQASWRWTAASALYRVEKKKTLSSIGVFCCSSLAVCYGDQVRDPSQGGDVLLYVF